MKWLNVVLDLNGILCVCLEERLMPRGQTYVVGKKPHSGTVPFLVGPKAVYIRPFCKRFLTELGNVADITIWSSMRVSTVKSVCDLLFEDLPVKPLNILGQESCDRIRVQDDRGKVSYMKVKGTMKDLFLKSVQKHLFSSFGGRYSAKNTIVVDDSPVKHVLNPSENIILPETWTFAGAGQSDTYLMDTLLPWVLQLHMRRDQGIRTFWNLNKIGRTMMCEDPFDLDYSEILKAIEDDQRISALFAQ
jgi:hypothetical protein